MGYITIDESDLKGLKKHGLITRDDYLTKKGACLLGRLEADKLYGEMNVLHMGGTEILCRIMERLLKERNLTALFSIISEAFKMAALDEPIYMDFLTSNPDLEELFIKEFITVWRDCLKKGYE